MRVFLTGATGFVGKEVLKELLTAGHQVVCLVRPQSYRKLMDVKGDVEVCKGTIFHLPAIEKGMKNCQAVIHLVGIIRPFYWRGITYQKYHILGTQNIITAAIRNRIRRFILMSALGVEKKPLTPYLKSKRKMEEMVIKNGFNYTIFRPSLIFGTGDQFINLFRSLMEKYLLSFVPIVGDGKYLFQPVSVVDVARAFVRSLNRATALGKIYELAGAERVSMSALIDRIACSTGNKKKFKLHIPVWMTYPTAQLLHQFPWFPVSPEQIKMLTGGNVAQNWQKTVRDLDLQLLSIYKYLEESGSEKEAKTMVFNVRKPVRSKVF